VADVDLSGKVALISGGSRGLGREMVLAFAEDRADVIIASRKLDNCEKLANEVSERFGRRALPVAANVGVSDQCDALTEAAYAEFGTVDILVNNAGMSPLYPSVDQVTEALYDKVFSTNLKGPFRLSAEPRPHWAVSAIPTKSSEPRCISHRTRAATPPVPYFESTEE
jgi:NAD(P)-dependent dehydrogenase (short-subunit alcohol dehydrogenase family)